MRKTDIQLAIKLSLKGVKETSSQRVALMTVVRLGKGTLGCLLELRESNHNTLRGNFIKCKNPLQSLAQPDGTCCPA